jgi:hypothetical protein
MGDRFGRKGPRTSTALAHLRGKPPPSIISWGLPAIGHNGGPPIEEHANDAFVRWRWRKVHREAWKNPSMSILRFRVARAEAAGVSYERYVAELLDTGRHLQRGDVDDDDRP